MNFNRFFGWLAIAGWILFVTILFLLWQFSSGAWPFRPHVSQSLTCPPGSYDVGLWCKAEPTGCAYGDNIPLDSPKCVPPGPHAYDRFEPEYQEIIGK